MSERKPWRQVVGVRESIRSVRRSSARVVATSIWATWVLTLECGHRQERDQSGGNPPRRVRCYECAIARAEGTPCE